uniref:Si:dkey-20d21.12 n=1 Tax=Amphilophus citrinellus TaxID=61819 RepID=A0A3Q0SH28_AMPCI
MSRPPSTQTTPQFYRVSDRDLTEIELHSVDSINDLHRTHPEHSHKMRPPRPAYTPSPNGNLCTCDMAAANQRGHPVSKKWQSRLQDMLTPSSSRAYAMGCAIITLLLLTVLLIFYFLQQGSAIRMLTEAVREKEAA